MIPDHQQQVLCLHTLPTKAPPYLSHHSTGHIPEHQKFWLHNSSSTSTSSSGSTWSTTTARSCCCIKLLCQVLQVLQCHCTAAMFPDRGHYTRCSRQLAAHHGLLDLRHSSNHKDSAQQENSMC